MRDIIKELCFGCYEPEFRVTKEYARNRDGDEDLWKRVVEAFGIEYADRLWNDAYRYSREEDRSVFRQGFHLGALLMLDLLYDPPQ